MTIAASSHSRGSARSLGMSIALGISERPVFDSHALDHWPTEWRAGLKPERSTYLSGTSGDTAVVSIERADLLEMLTRLLMGRLIKLRMALLAELDGTGWAPNSEQSRALVTVDTALTCLGYFDTD